VGNCRSRSDSKLLRESMLGREMDVLGSTRSDVYSFTHAVMYGSDFGSRRISLPRYPAAIGTDADAALAFSLDSNDFDLTAEILLTWPMLHLPWTPAATFAFTILAGAEDEFGFLPGPKFDFLRYRNTPTNEKMRFAIVNSYHTIWVMGFLCAVGLKQDCSPPAVLPNARRPRGAGEAIFRLIANQTQARWAASFSALTRGQQDSIAGLILAIVLRRAKDQGDLPLVRRALEIALVHDLIEGSAPQQAAALLRRSRAMGAAAL
jgi:uncharacterized protein DUF6895